MLYNIVQLYARVFKRSLPLPQHFSANFVIVFQFQETPDLPRPFSIQKKQRFTALFSPVYDFRCLSEAQTYLL